MIVVTRQDAAELIRDDDVILFGGSGGGHAVAEKVLAAIGERFVETGAPHDLTIMSVVGIGDWADGGLSHLAHKGLVRRAISGGFGNSPRIAEMAAREEIEAYLLPQGVLSHLCRERAAGRPGLITRVGLDTFVDPRLGGGRQNTRTTEDIVRLIVIDGEEFLFYKTIPIDVAVIRGTTADEHGNISSEEEAYFGENLSAATAARANGGITICQVKYLTKAGTIPGKMVKVPGVLVNYVVVEPDQWQTYKEEMNPAYAGMTRESTRTLVPVALDVRKWIARRAAMELHPGAVVNLGFGVSNGIALIAHEEGIDDQITLTNEQGVVGGLPAGGPDAGAGINFEAMIDQPYQFDLYDGGALDGAFLSFAQVDRFGNVNVSRFGDKHPGPGGFINISQGTKRVVFSGTLTAGGLDVRPDGSGGIEIVTEGRFKKWILDVEEITFSGKRAQSLGQQILYVTDRAVFELRDGQLVLVEIAPGIDLERDVLGQIAFPVRVASDLRAMDGRLFLPPPMGLAGHFAETVASREIGTPKSYKQENR